MDNKLCSIYL